jgi:hypothetical protein
MAKMDGAMSFGFFSIKPWCMPKTCSAPIFNGDDGCHIEKLYVHLVARMFVANSSLGGVLFT